MKTKIFAHRGASGDRPENTKVAFKKAIEDKADGVEFDVHLTKDEEIVVIHDSKVDRVSNGKGYVNDLTLSEIKELNIDSEVFSNQKILTLQETLQIVKEFDLINIEIKSKKRSESYQAIENKVISEVNSMGLIDKVIISSFNHYSLKLIKEINKNIKTALLYSAGIYKPWIYGEIVGVDAIHPYYQAINKEIVKRCHANGIFVNPFGTNNEDQLLKLFRMKVDGVIVDYPKKVKKLKVENDGKC